MSAVRSTTKLHLTGRESTFLVPVYITATVTLLSVLISLVFWRSGSLPGTAGWIEGSQSNPGTVYPLVGFLSYMGVASVATPFSFALTLGATRRAFVAGRFVWDAITAAYIAVLLATLTMMKIAADHWFDGFYIFDITALGGGDIGRLLVIVFLGVLVALTVGGVFGAAWVRFGARGPQLIAAGAVIAIAPAAILLVPEASSFLAAFEAWWLAVAAAALIALSSVATWLLLRPAVVR